MLHAIAGMIVSGEMNQECIFLKFRRAPQRCLSTDDLFDVAYQVCSLPSLVSHGMDHHVIPLAIDLKIVLRPIGRNFGRRIDHYVPVRKQPFLLAGPLDAPINNLPAWWWIDCELYRIRLVSYYVHKNAAAVVIGMAAVELRKRSREIVGEDFVGYRQTRTTQGCYAPGLIIDASY